MHISFQTGLHGQRAGSTASSSGASSTAAPGLQCNFYVWYEVDDEEEPTALRLEEYDGDDDCAWVLLEAVADGA